MTAIASVSGQARRACEGLCKGYKFMASEVGVRGYGGPGFTDRGVCLLELAFSAGQGCLSDF